ncbi:MAG: ABC transporter ATP-binding protein/permease [Clostridia bacterium]|nr:ABC transporter ATP-binding protein/permease [Clostridia bacterium]
MLEIKNITKTYTPKKGVPVRALDDVSLSFADTGMVFILGKSGSGKSTLLNVLGGLDQADSGEFIIKGKSSRDFSQSDFDSYRNTFIGFIFQEYNILEEFTVAQNIALAMELQGKRATSEALSEILAEVDLDGYGGRKPNELSGGQKQRVAIARALIKNPEMIMADEPTGALDSNTGKQVFDTLKKLSKTKLVLIVSHDRDFAEQYADRIIELKDGKILSDVSKKNLPAISHSEGVSVVDDSVIQIKRGYRLTERDLELINAYMEKASCDAIISIDADKNPEIKKVVKINDEGGRDSFLDTKGEDVKLKSYKPEDARLIRSKLPYKNSFKIGASSLKAKPVRLIFTVLLCFIAFALFGLADTMAAYNRADALKTSVFDIGIPNASFLKKVEVDKDGYVYYSDVLLNEKDLAKIESSTGIKVTPVYSANAGYYRTGYSLSGIMVSTDKLESPNGISVYNYTAAGYAEITDATLSDNGFSLLAGRLPSADGEIALPKFIFDQIKLAGLIYVDLTGENGIAVKKNLKAEDILAPSDIVGKAITDYNLGLPVYTVAASGTTPEYKSQTYTIVGVYDTHFSPDGFEDFLPDAERKGTASLGSSIANMRLSSMRDCSLHTVIAVNSGMIGKMIEYNKDQSARPSLDVGIYPMTEGGDVTIENDGIGNTVETIVKLDQMDKVGDIVWIDGAKTALAEGDVLFPLTLPYDKYELPITEDMVSAIISAFGIEDTADTRERLSLLNMGEAYERIYSAIPIIVTEVPREYQVDFVKTMLDVNPDGTFAEDYGFGVDNLNDFLLSDEYMNSYYENVLRDYISDLAGGRLYEENIYDADMSGRYISETLRKIVLKSTLSTSYSKIGKIRVDSPIGGTKHIELNHVGYFVPPEGVNYIICVSDSIYGMFGAVEPGDYLFAVGKMPLDSREDVSRAVDFSESSENFIAYKMNNESTAILDYVGEIIETLSQVFLYIGIGFAVFASLMMFNFISVSVSYKKQEIGILRAVGARSGDVFGIFFNESLIITVINFILSAVTTAVVCGILNNMFRGYGISVTILNFGIRQIALLLGLGVLVAFIGSFFPVMSIARKRPIDAIRNR